MSEVQFRYPYGTAKRVSLGALGAVAPQPDVSPMQWGYLAGSAVGAALVAGGIGYISGGTYSKALLGSITGLSGWAAASAVNEAYLGHRVAASVMALASVGALSYAWVKRA